MTNAPKFFSPFLESNIAENAEGVVACTCPFVDCEKPNHFYVNIDTYQWDCKRCGRAGNDRGFITQYHEQFLEYTDISHYEWLSEQRGISVKAFQAAQWAYDPWRNRWLIPYFNGGDFLCALGNFYDDPDPDFRIYKTANTDTISTTLYNPFKRDIFGTVYICEGEWDALALWDILGAKNKACILAAPGAHVWKENFLRILKDADHIVLLYDRDPSGEKGRVRTTESLIKAGKVVSYIDWSLIDSSDKDVRDLLTSFGPKEAAKILEQSIVMHESSPSDAGGELQTTPLSAGYANDITQFEPILSFDEYYSRIGKIVYLPQETRHAIVATLALTLCIKQDTEMIWAFLIGPPSCGKTTFIESFGGKNQYFDFMSKITAKSLVSGWKDDNGEDCSILPLLNGKTLFIKDFTVTVTASKEERNEAFGLLRDISDGTVKIPFGNNQIREYHDIRFNIVAGVTDAIHGVNTALVGERFLKIDFLGQNYNSRLIALQALKGFNKKSSKKTEYTKATLGLVRHLFDTFDPDKYQLTDELSEMLVDWGAFIALLRTRPDNDRIEGIRYKARAEIEARISLQLAAVLIGIAHVLNKPLDHKECFAVLAKVARDTATGGFNNDVVEYIFNNPNCSRKDIEKALTIPSTRLHRILTDMKQTGVITEVRSARGERGQPSGRCNLTPKMQRIMEAVEYED